MEICKKYEIELDVDNWLLFLGISIFVGLYDIFDNIFCEFFEGEIVVYERIDFFVDNDSSEDIRVFELEFIYVCIIEKEEFIFEMFFIYIVFDGENDVKVCLVWLFKFVCKIEEKFKEFELFSVDRIKILDISLDVIKVDIKWILIVVWKLFRIDRRVVIKRLLF